MLAALELPEGWTITLKGYGHELELHGKGQLSLLEQRAITRLEEELRPYQVPQRGRAG